MKLPYGIQNAAFAFRGYDVKNLGRTPELFAVPAYKQYLCPHLEIASEECSKAVGKSVDLAARIEAAEEFELEDYAEAVAMIVAVEQGQLDILRVVHGVDARDGAFNFGFSLGEIAALVASGTFELADALRVPLSLCADGVELAREVTLGIVFSRKEELSLEKVRNTLLEINAEGKGVIGISTHLSPNSVLVMGTGETIEMFKARLKADFPKGTNIRSNDNRWPPLHTPIVWERDFTSRAARALHTVPGGFKAPQPPVLSLVTGEFSYDDFNTREHMIRWVDQTQQMWDAVCEVLNSDIQSIIHVGPDPNIIPATFDRLNKNVVAQTKASQGMKALSAAIDRPWLRKMLPEKASLLRAPKIEHIVLEDWLLDNVPAPQPDGA